MSLPITYYWRNLFVRKLTTVLTVLVVAAVVGVFAWMAGFRGSLTQSLSFASDRQKLIVMKRGATAEGNSAIPPDEYKRLSQLDAVAVDPTSHERLESPETLVQVSLPRVRDGGKTNANVAIRGVTPTALRVHRNVRLLGPMFSTSEPEVIVGKKASEQFAGLKIGDVINLGYGNNRGYRVVGYFTADGGPMESEVWGYLTSLLNSYNRTMYSSVGLRLKDGVDPQSVIDQIEGPAIQMTALTEPAYWESQSKNVLIYVSIVGALVGIMSLAAVFSIANTMYASVAGRTRELAMLRTIGFPKRDILVGVLFESVILSAAGAALGCLGCWLWLRLAGSAKDMFGANTFTTMAFDIRLTPTIVASAVVLVCAVAVVGALFPALRAARVNVLSALREA